MSDSESKPKTPVIWVLGGPGSGKGTQCDLIKEKYKLAHLSSGDLLRAEVKSGSERGNELNAIMEKGELVPTQIVLDLLREAIAACGDAKGFLIDGYPREKQQGIDFEANVAEVAIILFFDAPDDILVPRLIARGKASGRVDDNEETIRMRLNTFHKYTDELVGHYSSKMKKIDANRPVDEVFAEVQGLLDPIFGA